MNRIIEWQTGLEFCCLCEIRLLVSLSGERMYNSEETGKPYLRSEKKKKREEDDRCKGDRDVWTLQR